MKRGLLFRILLSFGTYLNDLKTNALEQVLDHAANRLAQVQGRVRVGSLIEAKLAVPLAGGGLTENNQLADELIVDVGVNGARALQFLELNLDLGKESGGLVPVGVFVALQHAGGGSRAVEAVNAGGGVLLHLGVRLAPVLEGAVGVPLAADAGDGAGRVELAGGGVEGLQGRVWGDGGAGARLPPGAAAVGAGEAGLAGTHGLPVRPEAVDLGVVEHEDGIKGGELGLEELVPARGVPVDRVVDLLEADAVAAGGGELVEGG